LVVDENQEKESEEEKNENLQLSRKKSRSQALPPKKYKLAGIVTKRDIKSFKFDSDPVSKHMTKRDDMIVSLFDPEA
jgi:predicted transcriptional regulator